MSRIAMTMAVPDRTGAARMMFYFARAFRNAGHDVVVAHGREPQESSDPSQSIIAELRSIGVETRLCPLLRRPIPPFASNQVAKAIGRCDAVIGIHQRDRVVALKVAANKRVPGILAIQNQHNFWGPIFIPWLKRFYYARSVRALASRLICTSQATMNEAIAFGVDRNKCTVLDNGIELKPPISDRERQEARRKFALDPDLKIFSNVGRLDVQKGQDLLIHAWARRANPTDQEQLWLIGDITPGNLERQSTEYRSQLQSTVRDLGVEATVRFLGWRDDVPAILAASDFYVHSARWEGSPLAVMEAMAAGLPVIFTDCSGHPANFNNGEHGYVVARDKVASELPKELGLLEAINMVRQLPVDKIQQIGLATRQYCEAHYDIKVIGRTFVDLVESEIAKKNARPT